MRWLVYVIICLAGAFAFLLFLLLIRGLG